MKRIRRIVSAAMAVCLSFGLAVTGLAKFIPGVQSKKCVSCSMEFQFSDSYDVLSFETVYGVASIPGLGTTLYSDNNGGYTDGDHCTECTDKIAQAYLATLNNEQKVDPTTGSATIDIQVTREAAVFNVTVPTALPVSIGKDGSVSTATDAKIINNSGAPVFVQQVDVNSASGWTLAAFDKAAAAAAPLNTNTIGLSFDFGGVKAATTKAGSFETVVTNTAPCTNGMAIPSGGSCSVLYDASVPLHVDGLAQTQVANVVFTVGWNVEPVKLISFEIADCDTGISRGSFIAEEGMTWKDFIDSNYNQSPDGVFHYVEKYVYFSKSSIGFTSSGPVLITDRIKDGILYEYARDGAVLDPEKGQL